MTNNYSCIQFQCGMMAETCDNETTWIMRVTIKSSSMPVWLSLFQLLRYSVQISLPQLASVILSSKNSRKILMSWWLMHWYHTIDFLGAQYLFDSNSWKSNINIRLTLLKSAAIKLEGAKSKFCLRRSSVINLVVN